VPSPPQTETATFSRVVHGLSRRCRGAIRGGQAVVCPLPSPVSAADPSPGLPESATMASVMAPLSVLASAFDWPPSSPEQAAVVSARFADHWN
jgi:hypothetical protein